MILACSSIQPLINVLNLFLSKPLFLFLHGSLVKPWCLLTKTPTIVILFVLVLCRIFLAILISKSYIFILAQLILDKLKSFMIIQCIVLTFESIVNFWNTVLDAIIMHHIISCHSSMHSVASWSGICRLTKGYAFEYHFVGCLRFLSYRCWRYWVATFVFSCGGV